MPLYVLRVTLDFTPAMLYDNGIMTTKRKKDFAPHIPPEAAAPCEMPGCRESGMYKAPKSKDQLHDYYWYCLEHAREHNQQWDFFNGMDANEIEMFMKEAVTGHRPTWTRESTLKHPYDRLHEALDAFLHMSASRARRTSPALPAKLRKALAIMEMAQPYNENALKSKYRALVKKFHPDVNKGNKEYEEKFKLITISYHYLIEQLKKHG